MNELLVHATELVTDVIDVIAVLIVAFGTLEALYNMVAHIGGPDQGSVRRDIWLRYARWLVAALTFQLAADILETSIAPDWNTVGRLGAIAVIRTFLNYFLEKDLSEIRERQSEARTARSARNARHT